MSAQIYVNEVPAASVMRWQVSELRAAGQLGMEKQEAQMEVMIRQ